MLEEKNDVDSDDEDTYESLMNQNSDRKSIKSVYEMTYKKVHENLKSKRFDHKESKFISCKLLLQLL